MSRMSLINIKVDLKQIVYTRLIHLIARKQSILLIVMNALNIFVILVLLIVIRFQKTPNMSTEFPNRRTLKFFPNCKIHTKN